MNLDRVTDYLDFVEARHRVWEHRQAGDPQPWMTDPIVAERKFTNVFRVLDHGSQFVGRELLTPDLSARETLFRAFLYRHTGRPEPWEFFELMEGRYPLVQDLLDGTLTRVWTTYRGGSKRNVRGAGERFTVGETRTFDRSVFTGAYLVFPQSQVKGTDKVDSILDLARRLFERTETIMEDWSRWTSQRDRFTVLQRNKGVGDFMAMQVLTDWGYTTGHREDEFVVPGPGAVKGARALAPEWPALRTTLWAHNEIRQLGIHIALPDGRLRSPSLMDAQNTLCEFSKYVRFQDKPSSGKPYHPAHPGPQQSPWLPPLW